jgi:hypothetical protein
MRTGTALRVALGVALGAVATAWVAAAGRKRKPQAIDTRARSAPPEWHSRQTPGPDGRFDTDTLVDEALVETFPASDPPARTVAIALGSPPR